MNNCSRVNCLRSYQNNLTDYQSPNKFGRTNKFINAISLIMLWQEEGIWIDKEGCEELI